jgi:pimeloyl-ACP methyl ester carboxylesterase
MGRSTALTARDSFEQLRSPGPHEVRRGDLGLIGLPGVLFTPAEGSSLPAVAFGHGYLQGARRYLGLLRHLASWGIVAVATDTHRGPFPSFRSSAADLLTALDVCTGVRLGAGEIGVDPERVAVAGHGTGGGVAVLAAAKSPDRVRSVVTLAVAEVLPSALDKAHRCGMPALHIAAGRDRIAPWEGHAEPIARAWAGPVALRVVNKASHLGFTEGAHWTTPLMDGRPERRTQRSAKVLTTAFLLRTLNGDRVHDELLDSDVRGCPIDYRH